MAHNLLSATKVDKLAKPGRYADGGNLYLVVDKSEARNKRWVFRFTFAGKQLDMGLGGLDRGVPLKRARELAEAARVCLADGKNPITERQAQNAIPTFGALAKEYLAGGERRWRNAAHRRQWTQTLEDYAKPIWEKPVNVITEDDILNLLKPIWNTKRETAGRVRARIEKVLDLKQARIHRTVENPARWKGAIKEDIEPFADKQVGGAKHYAAMAFGDVPTFLEGLRTREATAGLALEFLILTACRSNEVLGAMWSEIDFKAKTFAVPLERMKSWRPDKTEMLPHVVPLSPRAIEILETMKTGRTTRDPNEFIFPGQRPDRPLSNMSFAMLLRRMKVDVTTHGFRSSFRTWCGERTNFPREIAEACLSHSVGNQVELAYNRATFLEKRRRVMDAWAGFCAGQASAKVVQLRQPAA